MRWNENNSKVMKCMREAAGSRRMNVALNGELLEEMECFE